MSFADSSISSPLTRHSPNFGFMFCEFSWEAACITGFAAMASLSEEGHTQASPTHAVLRALRARNRAVAPICRMTRACNALLTECAALDASAARQQTRIDLLSKERAELTADTELLRQNEANAGVSREHIELLQLQLDKAQSRASRSDAEAAASASARASAEEAAAEMGRKLADASALAADAQHALKLGAAREAALVQENERLLQRLTVQLQAEARAMDTEVERHNQRQR